MGDATLPGFDGAANPEPRKATSTGTGLGVGTGFVTLEDYVAAANETQLTPDEPPPPHVSHEEHLPRGIGETEEEREHHWFVGSIDQGTTSSRFIIFNGEGEPVASHQIEFENLYPKSG